MADLHRKLLVATGLIAGFAWALPTYDDGVGPEADIATVLPEFELQVRRSTVLVAGHAASARHEDQLRRIVAATYPAYEPRFELRPLGLVPEWWVAVTTDLVAALAPTTSPSVQLHEDSLHVRAVVADEGPAMTQLGTLGLPEAVNVTTGFERVTPAPAADSLCERQFRSFTSAPIRFEESTTVLRDSAYPVLDRIAALADACRNALVTITGHTDSSGNPDWNRRLSLMRAQAVAAFLASRGIDAGRLKAKGLGSSVPVADNATRYGRSMNRRIEIDFAAAD